MANVHTIKGATSPASEYEDLIDQLESIRLDILSLAADYATQLEQIPPVQRDGAANLLHYLALRSQDLRPLQAKLARLGLSSLGRAESHVLASFDALLSALHQTVQSSWDSDDEQNPVANFDDCRQLLETHTAALFGRQPTGRQVRIMVTMPGEAARDYTLVRNLVLSGMNCMRINCAHDDAAAWSGMVRNLRRAQRETGGPCRLLMDLAGPKLRTGPLEPGPEVVKIRPQRDRCGNVIRPARVWLSDEQTPVSPVLEADACLPVPGYWLSQLRCTDSLKFKDARGSSRTLKVVDVTADGCWAEARKTAYVIPGTVLRQRRKEDHGRETRATVGRLPALEDTIVLKRGDLLVLFRDLEFGRAASLDSRGEVLSPAMAGLPIPQVFEDVRPNEPVCFDDGRIVGNIEKAEAGRLHVRITRTTRPEGNRLGSYKGINFPESRLRLAAMTELDIEHLEFVCRHADMIALSFANEVSDLQLLESHIDRLDGKHPGIVLKIETRRGFENLPDMLLEAMRSPPCGVMIARGDLAVECGFERLAEVQEEILWLCEAAHVPVIWATQVLDHMAKTGLPSRAEISDAAMGQGADCVMLNKGKHIVKAVQALDSILVRMQGHQSKKQSMLRELNLASKFRDR